MTSKQWWVLCGLLLVAVATIAVISLLAQPLDVKRATVAELVAAFATASEEDRPVLEAPFVLAFGELLRRASADVLPEVEKLAADSRLQHRLRAVMLFGAFAGQLRRKGDAAAATACRSRLLELLRDPHPHVRVRAASQWSCSSPGVLSTDVPERVFTVVRELLGSSEEQVRGGAAVAAFQLGPRAAPLLPDLLAALAKEPAGGAQGMLAVALSRTRVADERVPVALVGLLGDERQDVRAIVVGSLAQVKPASRATLDRLFTIARDETEAGDVRVPALGSLARLVVAVDDAAALLELLLAWPAADDDYQPRNRLADLGRVAVLAPKSDAATRALEQLRAAMTDDDFLVATSAFARATVARGAALDAELVKTLRTGLTDLRDEPHLSSGSYWVQPVLEAMVDLAREPDAAIRADEVRPILERVIATGQWWDVEWATAALQRLP
jgi:hypothetical protein